MTIRIRLTAYQHEAIQTPQGAKVLVESMNKEMSYKDEQIKILQANMADVQDKYDAMRAQNHDLGMSNAVLSYRSESFVGVEVAKLFTSSIPIGYGINLTTASKAYGWLFVGVGISLYALIALWQSKTGPKSK